MENKFAATIEYGVCGYVMCTETFAARTIDELYIAINKRTAQLQREVEAADENDGDLRQYCPQFANGYPSLNGCGAELGSDEFGGTILTLAYRDKDLPYNSNGQVLLRKKTGLG